MTARPLRVLHVYRRFHPDYTGDGIYYTRLIPEVARHGVEGEVLVFETRPDHGRPMAVHDGVTVHYLANHREGASIPGLLRWLAANLRRYDVVHLHSHVDRQFLAYLLARLMGRRVIFSCTLNDSPTELLGDYRPSYRRVAALLMRSIGTFVVISPQLLRQSLLSTAPERLRFIPQGVSLAAPPVTPEDRAAARRALGLGPDDFILLNVGSVSRRKNVGFLVDAVARMGDPRVRLAVVGPLLEDDYAAEIAAIARPLGDRIILPGFVADPGPWYAAADAFAFASTAEGFPNVFLEAMARNLPIVTLFLPGLTDFIVDQGRSGYLARATDDFVAAVAALRADPARAARMGMAARRFAERNLEMGSIAERYAALYAEGRALPMPPTPAAPPAAEPLPDLRLRFAGRVSGPPAALGLREFDTPRDGRPVLQVVIDTEADFDWAKGTVTDTGRVSSIKGLEANFGVFRTHSVRPALVVDHPIATHPRSAEIVRALAAEGCEVGVHLHGWSTPPEVEPRDDWHSFTGNLGPALEREKLLTLCRRVEELSGEPPRLFKAGRYGLGPHTVEALKEAGFETDLSVCPAYDYSGMGGPDFSRFTSRPGWFGEEGGLLSLPTTAGRLGWLAEPTDAVIGALGERWRRRLRADRVAARLNLSYPVRLSPEGNDLGTMIGLTRRLHARGLRVFTLSLHSPTLHVGSTPYVRSPEDLRAVLRRVDDYLAFFRTTFGGHFSAPSAVRSDLLKASARRHSPSGTELPIPPRDAGEARRPPSDALRPSLLTR